jgi:hypothetical protein
MISNSPMQITLLSFLLKKFYIIKKEINIKDIGRIPWPLFVQFCCPPSGTTLNLHESIDFCTLSTNSLVVTCTNLYDQTSTFFIKISAILFRKLHVIYSYCTSSSLLAGGGGVLHAVLRIFIILRQSRSPSLRSLGRKRRLWDNPNQTFRKLYVDRTAHALAKAK